MKKLDGSIPPYALAVISGLLTALALPGFNIFPAAFAALIALFFALNEKSLMQSVGIASAAGLVTGLIYFRWVFQFMAHKSAVVSVQSVLMYAGFSLYHALWLGLVGAGYYFISSRKTNFLPGFVLSVASLWTLIEWGYERILPSYPWKIILPHTQWNNLFLLQWTSVMGMWFLTFFVAGCSVLLFFALKEKKMGLLSITLLIILGVHGSGYVIFQKVENEQTALPSLNIVVLHENVESRTKLSNADSNARRVLALHAKAVAYKPEIIVWSEGEVPRMFHTEDSLVSKALKTTSPSNASHLIGMFTLAGNNGEVYNSLYYIEPDGTVRARYDKKELLPFVEKPFLSLKVSSAEYGYSSVLPGEGSNVLATEYGKIGTLMCNESLSPYYAAEASRKQAQLLVSVSNNIWVNENMFTTVYFALTRMRAVELRKDIVVNSNQGMSGLVRASGTTVEIQPSPTADCRQLDVHLSSVTTFAAQEPDAVAYLSWFLLLAMSIPSPAFIKKKNTVEKNSHS